MIVYALYRPLRWNLKQSSLISSQQEPCTDWLSAFLAFPLGYRHGSSLSPPGIPPPTELYSQDQVRFSSQSGPWVLQWAPEFHVLLQWASSWPAEGLLSKLTVGCSNDPDLCTASGTVDGKEGGILGDLDYPQIPKSALVSKITWQH